MLNAPQQTCSGVAVAGVDVDELDLVGVGMGPQVEHLGHDDAVEPSPTMVISSTARPSALSVSPSSTGSPSMSGANSRSHESRTFMTRHLHGHL